MYIGDKVNIIPANRHLSNRIHEHGNEWIVERAWAKRDGEQLLRSKKDKYLMWVKVEHLIPYNRPIEEKTHVGSSF